MNIRLLSREVREMLDGRWALLPGLVLGIAVWLPGTVSSAEATGELPEAATKVVAAGFGFQNAESSSITVKTYDADTGEVLSDDTYELDIKEDVSATVGQPRERVFAGGVGLGAEGLSEFTLRVYDAMDGRFLWEGRLNLGISGPSDSGPVKVSAQVRPRLTLRQVSQMDWTGRQPHFYIRAVNAETGGTLWADQFSADGPGAIRAERIGRSILRGEPTASQDIEFTIRMFDEEHRLLLWEDRVTPSEAAEVSEAEPGGEAAAGFIPGSSTVWEADSAEI